MGMWRFSYCAFIVIASVLPNCLASSAQNVPDTLRYTMDEVVVTADRTEGRIMNATSSISVMRATELKTIPAGKLSDVFQFVPGFTVSSFDGVGRNPALNARGFFGGGEAEYNIVLIDGMPLNDLENGLVNWSMIPLQDVQSIEIVRGGSSPMYGDAALGAVINILTEGDLSSRSSLSLGGGTLKSFNVGASTEGSLGHRPYRLSIAHEQTNGYRLHSMWRGTSFGGMVTFPLSGKSTLDLSTQNQWVKSEDPGPLTEGDARLDPTSGRVFYKNDGRDERRHNTSVNYSLAVGDHGGFAGRTSYRYKKSANVRTLVNPLFFIDGATGSLLGLDPTTLFGDTQLRETSSHQVVGGVQYEHRFQFGTMTDKLLGGVDVQWGSLGSDYFSYFQGMESDFAASSGMRGLFLTYDDATRFTDSFFLNNEFAFDERFSVNFGLRYERIESDFNLRPCASCNQTDIISPPSSAWSPKVGLNLLLARTSDYAGSIYASFNRSFKAGTIDQLFDQRLTRVAAQFNGSTMTQVIAFPPLANSLLKPQFASTYEVGTYQRLALNQNLAAELTLVFYQSDLKDEIDFDIASLSYQNINESRHRGIESGLKVFVLRGFNLFANFTWSQVTFRAGQFVGNKLKGIPEHVFAGGISFTQPTGVGATLTLSSYRNTFLDDENTVLLSPYTILSARISYNISPVLITLDVENIADKKYSSAGYTLFGTTYLFPAAGRVVRGGVSVEL